MDMEKKFQISYGLKYKFRLCLVLCGIDQSVGLKCSNKLANAQNV